MRILAAIPNVPPQYILLSFNGSDNLNSKWRISPQVVITPIISNLILAMFMISLGVIIPEVINEYDLIEAEGGALLTSLLGAIALVIIIGEHINERIGEMVTMSIGFTIMSLGMIVGGYSISYGMLIASLFIAGIGSGIFIVSLYAFVGRVMPASRGAIVGFTNSSYALGGFLGPWISAMLIIRLGWRSPFHAIGVLAIILSFFLWFNLRRKYFRKETRKKFGGRYLRLLKDTRVILLCAAIGIGNFAFGSFAAWTPSYLIEIGKISLSEAGFAFGLYFMTGALGAAFFGTLSDKIGRRNGVLFSGIPAFSLTLLYFSGYIVSESLIVLSGVLGFFTSPYWNLIISAVQDHVDDSLVSSAMGLVISVAMMSATIAPTISGFMITDHGFILTLISMVAMPQLVYILIASRAT